MSDERLEQVLRSGAPSRVHPMQCAVYRPQQPFRILQKALGASDIFRDLPLFGRSIAEIGARRGNDLHGLVSEGRQFQSGHSIKLRQDTKRCLYDPNQFTESFKPTGAPSDRLAT